MSKEKITTLDAYVTINDVSGGNGNEYEIVVEDKYTDRELVAYLENTDHLYDQLIEEGIIEVHP